MMPAENYLHHQLLFSNEFRGCFLASLSLLNAPSLAFISQFFSISRLHVLLSLRSLNFSLNSIRPQ